MSAPDRADSPAQPRARAAGVSRSVDVAAPADVVWALVSDLPGMGRFSPETRGGTWTGGASGPAVGARFRGRNAQGLRRWSTQVTVVECVPGCTFGFAVSSLGLPVALWRYEVEPAATGCRVTESWTDRRGRLLRGLGALVTGVADREAYAATSVEATLAAVKAEAERTGHGA